MQTQKNRRYITHTTSTQSYVDGNTVRKMEVAEGIVSVPYKEPVVKEKAKTAKKKAKVERLQGLDSFSILFLCVALVFAGVSCVKYLNAQADATHMKNEIASLETNIMNLKEENKTAQANITSEIDLDYIYKIATKRLGMVHPKKNQVVTYESGSKDSVKQYGDIPKGTDKGLVDKILGKEK